MLPTYANQIGFRADFDAARQPGIGGPDSRDREYAADHLLPWGRRRNVPTTAPAD
jgi:hypothetical protein